MRWLFALALLLAACTSSDEIEITDAWVRAMPPGAGMTAGYFVLTNRSSGDLEIVGASSPGFGLVEMHRTVELNGMSRMQQEKEIAVEAGETIRFEPHGRHLMLMRPHGAVEPGRTVGLKLHLMDGREIAFEAEIRHPTD